MTHGLQGNLSIIKKTLSELHMETWQGNLQGLSEDSMETLKVSSLGFPWKEFLYLSQLFSLLKNKP